MTDEATITASNCKTVATSCDEVTVCTEAEMKIASQTSVYDSLPEQVQPAYYYLDEAPEGMQSVLYKDGDVMYLTTEPLSGQHINTAAVAASSSEVSHFTTTLSLLVTMCINCPCGLLGLLLSLRETSARHLGDENLARWYCRGSIAANLFGIVFTVVLVLSMIFYVIWLHDAYSTNSNGEG